MNTNNSTNSFMKEALALARLALSKDDVPVGAVIINPKTREIIGRGYNSSTINSDPTMHAEMSAIKDACAHLKSKVLKDCYIYVTLEPCAMCAAAISYARISRLYYGAQDLKFGAIDSNLMIYRSNLSIWLPEVYGGIEQDECANILKGYFKTKR